MTKRQAFVADVWSGEPDKWTGADLDARLQEVIDEAIEQYLDAPVPSGLPVHPVFPSSEHR
jgi:hypothetical protein